MPEYWYLIFVIGLQDASVDVCENLLWVTTACRAFKRHFDVFSLVVAHYQVFCDLRERFHPLMLLLLFRLTILLEFLQSWLPSQIRTTPLLLIRGSSPRWRPNSLCQNLWLWSELIHKTVGALVILHDVGLQTSRVLIVFLSFEVEFRDFEGVQVLRITRLFHIALV